MHGYGGQVPGSMGYGRAGGSSGGGGRGGGGRGGGGRGGGGRGAYYKARYGGGGRGGGGPGGGGRGGGGGGGGGGHHGGGDEARAPMIPRGERGSSGDLTATLRRIDGKQYKAYNDILGEWKFGEDFKLIVDRIQSDLFAPPSRARVVVPTGVARFPATLRSSPVRRTALADFLARGFHAVVQRGGLDQRQGGGGWSSAKGGELGIDRPGQHVLQRTSVIINETGDVEGRFTVALPAAGRTIQGGWAASVLVEQLPGIVQKALTFLTQDAAALTSHVESVEDQHALRQLVVDAGLVAFVRDGAILPRRAGNSDEPMTAAAGAEVIAFRSPDSLRTEFVLPNCGKVAGMGLKRGVSLIVGGGFHGKSTLLQALEVGCYNHIPGDGREFVVCDPAAVKIRAGANVIILPPTVARFGHRMHDGLI